jgi:hypothetical protein
MTNDPAAIISLIKATSALAIDSSVPAPGDWDKRLHPYVRVARVEGMAGGNIDFESASIGRLADGTQVMSIPLQSGGSGGVFTQIVFAQAFSETKPRYVGEIISGGHLAVNVTYHGIVAISPLYGPNDTNCCPTHFKTRTYTVVDRKLKLVSQKTTAKP